MGFLHKLWDETLAGPAPDSGLGKLRKYNSFGASPTSIASSSFPSLSPVVCPHEEMAISRSITILRTKNLSVDPASPSSASSSSPSTPSSPVTPRTRGEFKRLTMRKSAAEPIPTVYDWVVISALDR